LLRGIDVGLLGGGLALCLPLFLDVDGLPLGQRAVEGDGTLAGIIIQVSPALILQHVALILILHEPLPIFPFGGTHDRVYRRSFFGGIKAIGLHEPSHLS
jgi:hypothetical protein